MRDQILRPVWNEIKQFFRPLHGIAILVIAGLAIRIIAAPFTSWTYDVYPYYSATVDSLSGLGIYGHVMYSYPPLFMVVTYPFTLLLSLFQDPSTFVSFQPSMVGTAQATGLLVPYVTSPWFNLAIKAPIIICDLLVGLFIYQIVKELYNDLWAKRAFILWFLNPFVILIGSMMGQFDVLPALMTVVALYFAIKERYLLVGMALGFGTLLKVYPAFFVIFYFALIVLMNWKKGAPWISKHGVRQVISLAAGCAISLLAVIPFFLSSNGFMDVILRRTDYQQFGGISIWSIWNAFNPGTTPDAAFPILHLTTLIYVAILAAAIMWAWWAAKKHDLQENELNKRLVTANVLFVATLLLLQPLTNPQHLIWLLPLLILLLPQGIRMEWRFIALSITGALFLLSLQSYSALLYPLASFTNIVPISSLNNDIYQYFTATRFLPHTYVLGLAIFSAMISLVTIFLPSRYDPFGCLRKTDTREENR
jgi:Gpi18-like mannosyltransferase